jgi:hypothetical protein
MSVFGAFGAFDDVKGAACGVLLFAVTACGSAGGRKQAAELDRLGHAAQEVESCRAAGASKPDVQVLRQRMPLRNIDEADLEQMAEMRFASNPEKSALAVWSGVTGQCGAEARKALARVGLSSYIPAILANQDRQDHIFVQLVQGRIRWGDAVLRLKASRTALWSAVAEENDRRYTEFERSTEAARANRTAILDALTQMVP